MVVHDIQEILEQWAPPAVAWERDHVGLQIGSPRKRVRSVLVSLDVTQGVLQEARRKNTDLIISHHPLFFRPAYSVVTDDERGMLIAELLRSGIAVYSMHTNLDVAKEGVSHALAQTLNLEQIASLQPLSGQYQKIAVFVPREHADRVMRAMAGEGAGSIGDYTECSFNTDGTGTFTPLPGARPFIGMHGTLERVRETRVEMIVPRWKTARALRAMLKAHPYEEVAYDLYDLANPSPEFGAGAIGTLARPMTRSAFLSFVRRRLRCRSLRHGVPTGPRIRRVAVCGGSGSEYIAAALHAGADAYVTSDLRYHTYQETGSTMMLIDAGHYETEAPVVPQIVSYLRGRKAISEAHIRVQAASHTTNFVHYS